MTIEWAVLEAIFRGIRVVKGGLGSELEAEAWRAALEISQRRSDGAHFMATDGIITRNAMWVGSREIGPWR